MRQGLWAVCASSAIALAGLFTAAQLAPAQEPAAAPAVAERASEESTRDNRATIIQQAVVEIEAEAIAIGRRTRSPEIRQSVRKILEDTATITRIVGPDDPTVPPTRPPPTGGGGEPPPPTGPWVDPAQTGISQAPHQSVLSQYGWSLCDAKTLMSYSAFDNAVLNTQYQGCPGPTILEDTLAKGVPNPNTGAITNKWVIRAYDVGAAEARFKNCTFTNSYTEHLNYLSALGGILWERCSFKHAGSQAIQVVYANPNDPNRHHETRFWNPDDPTGSAAAWFQFTNAHQWEPHHVVECSFIDCGIPVGIPGLHPGERPSFGGSFFGGGKNPVRIERCFMQNTLPWVDANGVARTGFGAWMAHGRLRFELFDSYTNIPNGDRDIIQVWRVGDDDPATIDVYLRGGEVWGKQHIDIRPRPGDRIKIEGVKGDSPVLISYNDLYTWETSPTWDWGKVIYQGVVSQDLDLICQ